MESKETSASTFLFLIMSARGRENSRSDAREENWRVNTGSGKDTHRAVCSVQSVMNGTNYEEEIYLLGLRRDCHYG